MADVTFSVKDELGAALNGVLIRLFDPAGVFFTQGTTGEGANATGKKLFQGVATGAWTARFSLAVSGWSVTSPQSFAVTGTNDTFDVTVNLFRAPNAIDSNLCRCSGYFRDIRGAPVSGSSIHLINTARPVLLGNDGVLGERVRIETDSRGYASVDLIRKGYYRVELESFMDLDIEVRVPDAPSANLPDMLFPVVKKVTFAPTSLALTVGQSKTTAVTVRWRSGLELLLKDAVPVPVDFVAVPDDVISLSIVDGSLKALGSKAGTTTVTATRIVASDGTPITTVPGLSDVEGSIVVTVS